MISQEQHDKYLQVINTIGIEKVQQLYLMLGTERISIAALHRMVVRSNFKSALNGKLPVRRLAEKLKVSRMTVYRYMKKSNTTAENVTKR